MATKKVLARIKRAIQPQTAPQISAYWRDRGFKWVVNGTQPRELVSGLTLDPTGGATTEVNHSGKALANRSNGVGWTKSISSSPAQAATLVWFGDFYSAPSNNTFLAGILPNLTDTDPFANVSLIRNRGAIATNGIGYFFSDAASNVQIDGSTNAYSTTKNIGIVAKIRDGSQKLFTNQKGLERETTIALSGGGLFTGTPILVLGSGNTTRTADASCSFFAVSDQFLTDEECLSLAENPWQIFQQSPAKSSLWLNATAASSGPAFQADAFQNDAFQTAGVTGIVGTIAVTDGADVLSSAGVLTNTGTSTTTDGADVLSAAGVLTNTGTSATTDGADVLNASGSLILAGTLNTTDGTDLIVFNGLMTNTGSIATTDGADTPAFNGAISVSGTISTTDGADTPSFSGAVSVNGTIATTDGADTPSFTGNLSNAGSLAYLNGADALSMSGSVSAIVVTGTLNFVEGSGVNLDGLILYDIEYGRFVKVLNNYLVVTLQ